MLPVSAGHNVMGNILYFKVGNQRRKQFETEKLAQLVKRKSAEELRAKNIMLAEKEETGNQEVLVGFSCSFMIYFLPKAAEKRNNKLPQIQERRRRLEYLRSTKNTFSR